MINEKIEAIKTAVMEELAKSEHLQDIQDIRVKFLGKKGELTAIMKEMKNFSKEDRPKIGQLVNTARNAIEEQLTAKIGRSQKPKNWQRKSNQKKSTSPCRAVNRLRVTNIPSIRPCASWKTPSCAWAFPSSKGPISNRTTTTSSASICRKTTRHETCRTRCTSPTTSSSGPIHQGCRPGPSNPISQTNPLRSLLPARYIAATTMRPIRRSSIRWKA